MDTEARSTGSIASIDAEATTTQHGSQPSSLSPDAEAQAASFQRACHACSSRKVRCDKREPCSACVRTGRLCEYPPPGPRIRRTKKAIMADMTARINSLEKSLVDVAAKKTIVSERKRPKRKPTPEASDNGNSTPLTHRGMSIESAPGEDGLVQQGSSSQYYNEFFLSKILREEKSMESVLTPPQEKSHHHSPFNAMGILSSPCLTQPPSSFHPTAFVASRLWNIYKDTVDVCTSAQLLHVPTDELKLYSVIHDPANASYENLAFCYAIYYSSTVTLDEEEARAMMGQDRTTCLHTFKLGLEQSLAYGDFLDSPTVTMLAALSMYLGALRVQNQGKGVWTLNGLAIRMAQSIGLHRDGERLGLSPFQSEINRRLWWQLMCREGRAGEDYGLRHTKGLNFPSFDVRQPHNIDDVDLCPDSKEMPPERRSWTRTTFVLIKICIHEAQKKLASIAAAATATVFPSEAVRAQVVKESKARIEELLQYCNPVIPQQRLAMICARQIIQKLDFLTRHEWHLLDPGSRREDFATDENLKEAIGIVSVRDLTKDPLMDQFAMSNRAYPQYHVAMYVLWHLCVRPEGPYVASAWDAVDSMLELDQKKGCADQRYGYKSAVLRALKAKAMAIRDGTRRESDGSGIGDGQQQEPQQGTDVQIAADTAASYGDVYHMSAQLLQNGGMFGTAGMTAAGDPRNEDWQDWTMAAHSFHFDDEAMCNVFW